MDSKDFYVQPTSDAVPLYLVRQDSVASFCSALTPIEQNYCKARAFKGLLGECCVVHRADGLIDKVFVGAGAEKLSVALASAALLVPPQVYKLIEPCTEQETLSWALAQYRYDDYKMNEWVPRQLVVESEMMPKVCSLVDAICLVRDLINKPANVMNPEFLAETAKGIASTYEAEYNEWVGKQLLSDNFPAIHAVGRASSCEPRLISLTYGNKKHPRVVLVGKGVCFDSGGLDLKPSSGMRWMKKDMAGSAHVLGLAQWIMHCKLPIRLEVLIPAVENAVGPDAYRPGDVLVMRNGLSVEIDNTDAEGRLILADALVKACEEPADLLIDFSTLTGAARTAVGTEIASYFCNNESLVTELNALGNTVGEPLWRLPLYAGYEELLNSNNADLVNSGGSPYAGAIVAGLFLQRFIKKDLPWLHFDIMAWNLSSKPGRPEGGEAMGLRTIAAYLQQRYGMPEL